MNLVRKTPVFRPETQEQVEDEHVPICSRVEGNLQLSVLLSIFVCPRGTAIGLVLALAL